MYSILGNLIWMSRFIFSFNTYLKKFIFFIDYYLIDTNFISLERRNLLELKLLLKRPF